MSWWDDALTNNNAGYASVAHPTWGAGGSGALSRISPGFAAAQEQIRQSPGLGASGPPGLGGYGSIGDQVASQVANAQAANGRGGANDPFAIDNYSRQMKTYGNLAAQSGADQLAARAQQGQLIQQLQDQAAGRGPSLAQMQLQQGMDQNIGNAMALGYSQRGAGQAGMLKGIQGQAAGIGNQMANDSAMLRMQEQMAARSQLGGLLGGVRGQDIGQQQYGMSGATGLGLAQTGLNVGRLQNYQGERLAWDAAQRGEQGAQDARNNKWYDMIPFGVGTAAKMVGGLFNSISQMPGSGEGGK